MQIRVHKVKDQVYIPVILSPNDVLKPNDILVTGQLLQKYDFSESPLSVCGILKGIEVLLQSYSLLGSLVNCLPHNTVCSLT